MVQPVRVDHDKQAYVYLRTTDDAWVEDLQERF